MHGDYCCARGWESRETDIFSQKSYRLGPFGFLTSGAMREAGYLPNNGLHDQKLGFRWVRKHIAGFGGDPDAVTYVGCSIGAGNVFSSRNTDSGAR